jgi:hypothetical protein
MVTPGVAFLLRSSPVLSIPLVLGVGLRPLSRQLGGPEIAAWIVISLALTSLPLYAVLRVLLRDWRNQRAAEALGARLVPVKKGKSIGSIDILRQMRHNRKHGYPGTNSTHHSVCAYVRKSERTR